MTKQEIAAYLLVLEHRAQEVVEEVRSLFQMVLDSIEEDSVE